MLYKQAVTEHFNAVNSLLNTSQKIFGELFCIPLQLSISDIIS